MYPGIYTLIGQELSMFTRKLEAQLLYQNIPYQWQYKTFESAAAIDARAGTRFVPLLQTPDGWLLNDTISIGPMLHERFSGYPVIPKGPNQRSACFVLEDLFNHWLPRHALHSRWCYAENVTAAGKNFGMNLLLGRSIDSPTTDAEEQQIADVGEMMYNSFGASACVVQGAGDDQSEAIKKDFGVFVDLLVDHFDKHDFLLGNRACLADFALVGPFKAHFLLDPEPKAWLGDNLALFEGYVARVWQAAKADAHWLAEDELLDTIHSIFNYAQRTYQQFAASSIGAAQRGDKFFDLDVGYGPFTARSMKRLEKARLHVREELLSCAAQESSIHRTGILDYYLVG